MNNKILLPIKGQINERKLERFREWKEKNNIAPSTPKNTSDHSIRSYP